MPGTAPAWAPSATPAGHDAFEQHANSEEHGEAALLSVLSAGEKQMLADLLRKLVIAVETGPGR